MILNTFSLYVSKGFQKNSLIYENENWILAMLRKV